MRTYETVFILKVENSTEEYEKHISFYKENIANFGGEVLKTDVWGKQTLAYPIEKHNEGYYVLIQFKAESNYINEELEKRFQFNESVLRYVVVMLDEKRFKQNPRREPAKKEVKATDKPAEKPTEKSAEKTSKPKESEPVAENQPVEANETENAEA